MEIITKNNIDKQHFSLFIRDLSETLNTNLKHVIEDTIKTDEKSEKPHRGKKKPIKKKADIIRESQNAIREKKLIETDYNKINYLHSNKDLDN